MPKGQTNNSLQTRQNGGGAPGPKRPIPVPCPPPQQPKKNK